MGSVRDILLLDDGDLAILNGDFVTGYSDQQHIALILQTAPGNWKQNPFLGANLQNDLVGPFSPQDIQAQITLGLQVDSFKNIVVTFKNGQPTVSANH